MLGYNPNITWETIDENPDRPWYYLTLCCNPMNGPHTPKARMQARARAIRNELGEICLF